MPSVCEREFMAAPRTERLLNLVICLLAATRYISKEQIRSGVPQYGACATTEAFERMFERDKDDLRDMGIPLETGSNDTFFDDELGYRIPKDAYELPEVSFDSEELAILGLAARTWQHATMSGAAAQALRKLEAAGVDVDRTAQSGPVRLHCRVQRRRQSGGLGESGPGDAESEAQSPLARLRHGGPRL